MFLPSLRSALRRFVVAPARDLWQPPAGQLGSLDFLRTCAVLMVILFHLREAYLLYGGEASLLTRLPLVKYGIFGVDLFFVLSGYLIGKQLWKELATSGTIHIPRFLVRRGLRIWPLYYAFIVLNAILSRWPIPLGTARDVVLRLHRVECDSAAAVALPPQQCPLVV